MSFFARLGRKRFGMNRNASNPLFKMTRSEGGATPRVKKHSDMAEQSAINEQVPWILAKMYAPPPIVNTDQTRDEGIGMVDRVYLPGGDQAKSARTFADKMNNWLAKGDWS